MGGRSCRGLMGVGEEEAVRAVSELRIKVGDAGAVGLRLNGAPVRSLGGAGQVVTLRVDSHNVGRTCRAALSASDAAPSMDPGLRTPLVDFFRRGEVARDVRLLAAQGAFAPRALDQLALLLILKDDADPEIAGAAASTIERLPRPALEAFIGRLRRAQRHAAVLHRARRHRRRRRGGCRCAADRHRRIRSRYRRRLRRMKRR